MGADDWGSRAPKIFSPTPAATIAIDPQSAEIFKWTPGEAETVSCLTGGFPCQRITFIIGTTDTSRTITFGTLMHSSGTLATGTATGKFFTIDWISDGIAWYQVGLPSTVIT